MRVHGFEMERKGLLTTVTAQFTFNKPFIGRREVRFFLIRKFIRAVRKPKRLLKDGITVTYPIWFQLPTAAIDVSKIYEAFFTLAIGLAIVLDENLEFEGEVSTALVDKLPAIKSYFESPKSRIVVRLLQPKPIATLFPQLAQKRQGVAQFFTLGVDSFYTLLCDQLKKSKQQLSLLYVDGYDVPLSHSHFLQVIHRRIHQVGAATQTTPLFVRTNLREVSDHVLSWGRYHVSALAAVGMMLHFHTILINGESFEAADWGLRKGADRLFSLPFIHTAFIAHNMTRDVKLDALLHTPQRQLFLNHVRVCWQNIQQKPVPYNCSECQKCFKTQLMLWVLGVFATPTFKPKVKIDKLRAIQLVSHVQHEWLALYKRLKSLPTIPAEVTAAVKLVIEKPLKT